MRAGASGRPDLQVIAELLKEDGGSEAEDDVRPLVMPRRAGDPPETSRLLGELDDSQRRDAAQLGLHIISPRWRARLWVAFKVRALFDVRACLRGRSGPVCSASGPVCSASRRIACLLRATCSAVQIVQCSS